MTTKTSDIFFKNPYNSVKNNVNYYLPTTDKIKKVSYDVFSVVFFPLGIYRASMYLMHRAVGLIVVQSQSISKSLRDKNHPQVSRERIMKCIKDKYINHFDEIKEVNISSFDKTNLNNMVFKKNNAKGTIIFFGGTAYSYEGVVEDEIMAEIIPNYYPLSSYYPLWLNYNHDLDKGLLYQASKANFNVVLCNTRGTGLSDGYASEEALEKDAVEVLKFVKQNLSRDEDNIVAYGHSLGGFIATKLANNSNVKLINDRSFSNLSNAVTEMVDIRIIKNVAAFIVRFFGWEMNSKKGFDECKNKKVALFGKRDYCINEKASLKEKLDKKDADKIFALTRSHHMSKLTDIEFNSIFLELFENFKPIKTT